MAIVEVKVPQLSESVAEATMLTWKKKAGEAVAVDEILIEIETDKVVLEVPAPAPAAVGGSKGDVAMPAAAKLLAENNLSASAVAGSGKDGRVTKGDVLSAVAGGAAKAAVAAPSAIPTGVPTKVLPQVSAPAAKEDLGDRPEQRVPMSRLRARVAER